MELDDIETLLETRGEGRYGLHDVTQKEHALQTAALAVAEGAPDALVAAALLHDIGHLLHDLGEGCAEDGVDDRHEEAGYRWLASRFGPEVVEPIRLHVAAKRYLCAIEPAYADRLCADSRLSLELQGGPMSAVDAAAFATEVFADDAVRLRRWDDAAKIAGLRTQTVTGSMPYVRRCLREA